MFLPYGLHINPLTVIQSHGGDEIIGKHAVVGKFVFPHIILYDLCVYLIIYVLPVQGFCLSHIVVGIHRLNASGDPQHGGQGPRGGDGQQLRISQSVFLHQFPGGLRGVCLQEGSLQNLLRPALGECSLFLG